jgi:hypothetical protein
MLLDSITAPPGAGERAPELAFRSIIVAVEDSADGRAAVAQAVDLAMHFRARLTFVGLEHMLPWVLGYGANATAFSIMMGDAELRTSKALAHAIGSTPVDIPVTTIRACEPAFPLLKRLIHRGEHDLLVVGARSQVRSIFGTHVRLGKVLAKSTTVDILVARASAPRRSWMLEAAVG